eukprot:1040332-Lingulodinium_polyedra.AAC.1
MPRKASVSSWAKAGETSLKPVASRCAKVSLTSCWLNQDLANKSLTSCTGPVALAMEGSQALGQCPGALQAGDHTDPHNVQDEPGHLLGPVILLKHSNCLHPTNSLPTWAGIVEVQASSLQARGVPEQLQGLVQHSKTCTTCFLDVELQTLLGGPHRGVLVAVPGVHGG